MLKLLTAILLLIIAINTKGSYVYIKDEIKDQSLQANAISTEIAPFEIFKNSLDLTSKFPNTFAQENKGDNNEKSPAYNESSGKVIEKVSEKAIENSPVIETCVDNPSCVTNTPAPFSTLTPTNTQTPTPSPQVTIIEPGPHPISITPHPKCELMCPMVACLNQSTKMERPEVIYEDCHCPCVPPQIY